MAKNNRKVIREQLNVITNDLARSFPRYALIIELYLPYTEPIESVLDVARLVFEVMATTENANLEVIYKMLVEDEIIDSLGHYWHEILMVCTFMLQQKQLQENVQEMYNHH